MKESLHIIFLDFDDIKNPFLGAGQARSTYEVASRMIKKGHKVTVISSRYPGYKDRFEKGIYYRHIGVGTKNIRLNNIAYIFSLPFIVRRLQADIIIECFTAPISTLCSPLFTRIPVVGKSTSFEANRFANIYHLPFDKVEKYGSRLYKYFIASTNSAAKKITELNSHTKTTVIHEGVGDEYFTNQPAKRKYILFLGRLDISQKGIDILLHAYKKISSKTMYPLVIAGHGPDKKRIEDMIHQLGLEGKVSLVGPAYDNKKRSLLKHAAVVALPSRYEGFSLFTLEALASGVPVVSFNIKGLEWTRNTGIEKAVPFNFNEYAKILLKTAEKGKLKANIAAYKKVAKRYSWDSITEQYLTFFHGIVENNKKDNVNDNFALLDSLNGKLLSFFYKKLHKKVTYSPVSGFSFLKELKSPSSNLVHRTRLYMNDAKEKVIIRQIPYQGKTLEYIQTYNVWRILSMLKKIHKIRVQQYTINFPKVIGFHTSANELSLLSEYREGKMLTTQPTKTQISVLSACLKGLTILNKKLSDDDKKILAVRKSNSMAYTFPLYALLAFIKKPSLAHAIFTNSIEFYKLIFSSLFIKKEYVVSHRDLHEKNILIDKKNISILDSEIMVLAEKNTDLAYIARFWYGKIGIEGIKVLIKERKLTNRDKEAFIRLSIYYTIQLLAMVSLRHEQYARSERYLVGLTDDVKREVLTIYNRSRSILATFGSYLPVYAARLVENYRPIIYNTKVHS